jgi:4,5-dihydroxyphthalate decarboxylase
VPQLRLKTVTRTQGANRALKDGSVTPRSATLELEEVPVLVQAFRRMVRQLEYDVCEMALTTYLCAKSFGVAFTALPVFLVRGLHHGAIVTHPGAGVQRPEDLHGRTVGVNRGYTVTTGVWARAILAAEHGVDLDAITWAPSGDEHVAQYRAPANVVPLAPGADLGELLVGGELAAVVGADLDRAGVVPLIPEPHKAALEALTGRGFYPINHLVVVRDELLDAHPELAADLFQAFAAAKQRYLEQLPHLAPADRTATDRLLGEVWSVTGSDPLPYGIEPNRAVLEELIDHAVHQKILDRRVGLTELFAAGTEELVG